MNDKARFLAKTRRAPNGCLLWTAALDPSGYGRFWLGSRMMPASQAAYRLFCGEIPAGYEVRHAVACQHKHCVERDHLLLGTHAENMADLALTKGNKNQKIDFAQAREMRKAGHTYSKIASHFGATVQAVKQGLDRHYGTSNF